MRLKRLCPLFFALLLLFAVPAFAGRSPIHLPGGVRLLPTGGPVVPPSFQGIWNYTSVTKDCETMTVLFEDSGSDTICANEVLAPPDTSSGAGFVCDGDVTNNGYHLICMGTLAIDDTCSVDYNYDITTTLNGNTLTTLGIYNIQYTHCGPFFPPQCFRFEYTATRVGNANAECDVPVESTTWSFIKNRYR